MLEPGRLWSLGKGQKACCWAPWLNPHPKGCPACSWLPGGGRAGPRQKQFLCARLVEVREALTQIKRKQALQDSERKGAEQEASLRWAPQEAVSGPAEGSCGSPQGGQVTLQPRVPTPSPSPSVMLTGSLALSVPGGDTEWASGLSVCLPGQGWTSC